MFGDETEINRNVNKGKKTNSKKQTVQKKEK